MPISETNTPEFWNLLAFSEWLDQNGLMHANDERTHENLVDEFVEEVGVV
jgi:hypothetical protein